MTQKDEFELIREFFQRTPADPEVRLGVGDDAALVAVPAGQELVVSTDTLVGGRHFPEQTPPFDIGWKALAVNLSDLAAMGAQARWVTLALTLPASDEIFLREFAQGFFALADRENVTLIGGDTTRGPLTASVTAFGFVPIGTALRRDGARVGDAVLVTGTMGDAAAGLGCVGEQERDTAIVASAPESARIALRARLDRPQPRIAVGERLRGRASACIDVSDGLVADLGHIAAASGVGIEIELARVPASEAFRAAVAADRQSTLQLAGGDDYELAFTIAEADVEAVLAALRASGLPTTRIGRVVRGSGVRVLDRDGNPMDLPRRGWEHFT